MEITKYFIVSRRETKDWSYYDAQETKSEISTIEMMAKLTAKIAAAFQYCDDKDEICYFEIRIKKIVT